MDSNSTSGAFAALLLLFGNLFVGIPCVLILWFFTILEYGPHYKRLRDAAVPLSWIVALNGIWWKRIDPFYLGNEDQRLFHFLIVLKVFIWIQLLGLGLLIAKAFKAWQSRDRREPPLDLAGQDRQTHRRFRIALVLLSWDVVLNAIWIPVNGLPHSILHQGPVGYLILNLNVSIWAMLVGLGLLVASAIKTRGSGGPGKWFLITIQTVLVPASVFCWYQIVRDPFTFQIQFWPPLHGP